MRALIWMCGLALNLICCVHCSNQPEVRISQGSLKGLYTKTINNRHIGSFEGIPYAKPPTGKHRFKAPVASGLWYGVLNATKEPPQCLQYNFDSNSQGTFGSEDCLYINVYTPQLPTTSKQKLLDVIAFIHGGAFSAGQAKEHSPFILLDRDVVLVTFNYRLGPLGFLSTEDHIVPGNNGLKDQVVALKWIQQNIAVFGGNPKSVILGGLSSGGASCHYHLLSPLSKGLFKGAICMGGIALNPWAVTENSNQKAKLVANELGCPTNDSSLMINCLRNRPAEHIVGLSPKLMHWHTSPAVPYGPVIEPVGPEAFISEQPIDIIKNKEAADVPMIISFTADEGLLFVADIILNNDTYNELLNRWDEVIPHMLDYNFTVPPDAMDQISKKIKEHYKIDNSADGRRNLVKLFSDRYFYAGISKLAKISALLYSSPMYLYKFSYRGELSLTDIHTHEKLGVCHADDIYYTLGHFWELKDVISSDMDLKMSQKMLDVWISFAANGTLGENWQPVNKQFPNVVYTDIKTPNDLQLNLSDELGEESFWDSLGLNENIVSIASHDEL